MGDEVAPFSGAILDSKDRNNLVVVQTAEVQSQPLTTTSTADHHCLGGHVPVAMTPPTPAIGSAPLEAAQDQCIQVSHPPSGFAFPNSPAAPMQNALHSEEGGATYGVQVEELPSVASQVHQDADHDSTPQMTLFMDYLIAGFVSRPQSTSSTVIDDGEVSVVSAAGSEGQRSPQVWCR